MMNTTMLIVEDDTGLRSSLEKSFRRRGHTLHTAGTLAEARQLVAKRKFDLILLDNRLPDGSGLEFLTEARRLDEDVAVIMMTAFPEVQTAVRTMKEGARDFIVKPFELDELHLTVTRAIEGMALRRDVRRLTRERRSWDDITEILGESPVIEEVRAQIRKVAPSNTPVLVVGATGTGKELVANSLHRLSPRAQGPLVKVNCSAFSEQILESELFGHEKGAFTDALAARPGLFEMSDQGTLLLDEISEMKPSLQAKLLRVIEGMPFRRVGGQREISADVRVIAATNRDLGALIAKGLFRPDLYFRLNAFQISVPPLNHRGNDVVLLAHFFLQRSAAALRKGALRLAPVVEQALLSYDWPGNVRELRNVMERAAILCEADEVGLEHLPGELQASRFVRRHAKGAPSAMPSLRELERRYIAHVVKRVDGNLSAAARLLGIARNTLKAKLATPRHKD